MYVSYIIVKVPFRRRRGLTLFPICTIFFQSDSREEHFLSIATTNSTCIRTQICIFRDCTCSRVTLFSKLITYIVAFIASTASVRDINNSTYISTSLRTVFIVSCLGDAARYRNLLNAFSLCQRKHPTFIRIFTFGVLFFLFLYRT